MVEQKAITLLGAGSWGTAIALYLARRGQRVKLWSVEPAEITAMLADKANQRYLPGFALPNLIEPTADLSEAVAESDDVIVVVPSVGFRATLLQLQASTTRRLRLLCASKGLDAKTGALFSTVTEDIFGKHYPFAILSGPSFAGEVAAGLPAAVVIASQHGEFLADLVARFNSAIFHIDVSDDVIGVEIGGVVKNVIAIATGLADGLNLGANARSAIITRGLAEIIRLGVALGGKQNTFIGLAGLGDLILTCSDNQSRNRRLGLALGKGDDMATAQRNIGQAIEGKRNAEIVCDLAKRNHITMPVCETVWQILQTKLLAKDAIPRLISGE